MKLLRSLFILFTTFSLFNLIFAFQNTGGPEFEVPIYQGYLPVSDPENTIGAENAEKLFIYTGNKDNKSETQNQYMLLDDLTTRLTKGCETAYNTDWENLRKGKRPFDVWNAKGMLIQEENNFLSSIRFPDGKVSDALSHTCLEDLFRLYCGT